MLCTPTYHRSRAPLLLSSGIHLSFTLGVMSSTPINARKSPSTNTIGQLHVHSLHPPPKDTSLTVPIPSIHFHFSPPGSSLTCPTSPPTSSCAQTTSAQLYISLLPLPFRFAFLPFFCILTLLQHPCPRSRIRSASMEGLHCTSRSQLLAPLSFGAMGGAIFDFKAPALCFHCDASACGSHEEDFVVIFEVLLGYAGRCLVVMQNGQQQTEIHLVPTYQMCGTPWSVE